MAIVLVAAVLLGGRARLLEAFGLSAALVAPRWTGAAVAALVLVNLRRDRAVERELPFHQAVASELRGGASLRHALAGAVASTGDPALVAIERRLLAGHDIEGVAAAIRPHLRHTGRLAEAAIVFGARSGGRAAAAFTSMAEIAGGELEVRREVAAALAPAWLAVGLIGGAPLVGLLVLVASGRLSDTISSVPGRVSVAMGGVLIAAGAAAVWVMAQRALR